MPVQNMLLYPSQEYAHYERPQSAVGGGNSIQQNAALMLGNLAGGGGSGSGAVGGANAAEPSYPFFSLRPLIDSIFEVSVRISIIYVKARSAFAADSNLPIDA